ncbi:hypothetical protein ACHAWU_002101 [Discostella pseudostelligera]|uniref:Peptidase M3A/M3B catalytic domain-containing protein n=1 Tax=Discostella pseudostelligera TaxID=259834 RepID=A0ABD3MFG3_9STRA
MTTICNHTPSSSSSSQTLLSRSEVQTLYHEFGHGLHSLLSRTSFQHLLGTLIYLNRLHCITGIPMSDRRARHLALSHSDFRGIEVQTQIVHSEFDQALFGHTPSSPSLGGCNSTEMFKGCMKKRAYRMQMGRICILNLDIW